MVVLIFYITDRRLEIRSSDFIQRDLVNHLLAILSLKPVCFGQADNGTKTVSFSLEGEDQSSEESLPFFKKNIEVTLSVYLYICKK